MNYLNTPAAQALGWTLLHFLWEGASLRRCWPWLGCLRAGRREYDTRWPRWRCLLCR